MISEVEQAWHAQNLALKRQARDERLARERERLRAGRERMEKTLRAKFVAQTAAALKKAPLHPADSGPGWRVLETPRVSHAALEEHAHRIFDFVWHGIDRPDWRIRWGELDGRRMNLLGAEAGLCADARHGRIVYGLAVSSARLILIDEEAQRSRSPREFGTTLIHEMIHAQQRGVVHGPRFQEALKSATDYFFGAADAPVPSSAVASSMAPAARPTPRVGVRYPFPQLEFRG